MKTAEYAKAMGFKSLKQCAGVLKKPTQTLHNWHRDSPELFEAAVIGAKVLFDRNKTENN